MRKFPDRGVGKRVCMIVYTDYVTDTRVRREAETLAQLPGYRVIVISNKSSDRPKEYTLEGVKVLEINEPKYYGNSQLKYLLSYFSFVLRALVKCTSIFFKEGIDVVHVHNMPNFLVFASLVPRTFGRRVVLDIHDTIPETYAAKFSRFGGTFWWLLCKEESIACRYAHKIICVNSVQRDTLVGRGVPREKTVISMNVLDEKVFRAASGESRLASKRNGTRLVYHGTIAKRLGIDLILRSMSLLIREFPSLELHIWGRAGGDLNEIEDLARGLGLGTNVIFHEPLPMDKLVPRLLDMDVGVIANRKSAATELMLPVKLLEYAALGIPAAAPKLKTIQHYFGPEMVSYFEPEDVESMAQAIGKLLREEDLRKRQAQKAKQFIEKYSWSKHKRSLLDLYENL